MKLSIICGHCSFDFSHSAHAGIAVPERENSFQKRLTAALARRTGKINILPKVVFPGK